MNNGQVLFTGSNADEVAATLDLYVYPHPTQAAIVLFAYRNAANPLGTAAAGQTVTVSNGSVTVTGTPTGTQLPPTPGPGSGGPNYPTLAQVQQIVNDAVANVTSPVQSVAGRTGAVSLIKADVGLAQASNTADVDKPVSTAQSAAIAAARTGAAADAAAAAASTYVPKWKPNETITAGTMRLLPNGMVGVLRADLTTGATVNYGNWNAGPNSTVYQHGAPTDASIYPIGSFVVDVDDSNHLYEIGA